MKTPASQVPDKVPRDLPLLRPSFFVGMMLLCFLITFTFAGIFTPIAFAGLFGGIASFFAALLTGFFQTSKAMFQIGKSLWRSLLTARQNGALLLKRPVLNQALLETAAALDLRRSQYLGVVTIDDMGEQRDLHVEYGVSDCKGKTIYTLSSNGRIPDIGLGPYSEQRPQLLSPPQKPWEPYARLVHALPTRIPLLEAQSGIVVEGPEELAFAVLHHELREPIARLIQEGGFRVEYGAITLEQIGFESRSQRLIELLSMMEELAALLSVSAAHIPQRLADGFEKEEGLELRVRNLELLQFHFPDHSLTQTASRAALEEDEYPLRFLGAIQLKDEGMPTLEALCHQESAALHVRKLALERVAKASPKPMELLWAFIEPEGLLSGKAAQLLGMRQVTEAFSPLLARLKEGPTAAETQAGIICALAALSADPTALELEFLALLPRLPLDGKQDLVRELGGFGGVHSLRPLGALLDETQHPPLRETIEGALLAIRSRTHVEAGHLSMMEVSEAGGGLSIPQASGGLSLGDVDGGLSIRGPEGGRS